MAGRPRRRATIAEAQVKILFTFVTALAAGRLSRSQPIIRAARLVQANFEKFTKRVTMKGKRRVKTLTLISEEAEKYMTT